MATNTSNFNFQGIGIVHAVDGGSGGGGCTDNNAINYNPSATEDNGTCIYDNGGPGCTNENAFNYNPAATSDDGSCVYNPGGGGCTDPLAVNYNSTATSEDGSCVYVEIAGCTDPGATNYDFSANSDDGSCDYLVIILGCTGVTACNYDALANTDDGSCILPDGCTNDLAINYNATAVCDDGSCVLPGGAYGCTDSLACNYTLFAINDDGSCDYSCLGCMDDGEKSLANNDDFDSMYDGHSACNYDPSATVNDGSCYWNICCHNCDFVECQSTEEDCCSYSNASDACIIPAIKGCMDDGSIVDYICVMDPTALYDYTLDDGTVVNANAQQLILLGVWPGAGNGDHPDFVNQSNCYSVLYTNNSPGSQDPGQASIGSINPPDPAINYSPMATVDDGSCEYEAPVIKGCLDEEACNYDCAVNNTTWTYGDGFCSDGVNSNEYTTCVYPNNCTDCEKRCNEECLDEESNFCSTIYTYQDPEIKNCCMPKVYGCMDALADNYNCPTGSTSTIPCGPSGPYDQDVNVQDAPSSCITITEVYGCMDEVASNYNPNATIDDGSCEYIIGGCPDPNAANYDPLVTFDDGSCCYGPSGCMDVFATNYDPIALCDDGSCEYIIGCMDQSAKNYDPLATFDDGCVWCRTSNCVTSGVITNATSGDSPMVGMVNSGVITDTAWAQSFFDEQGIGSFEEYDSIAYNYFVAGGLVDVPMKTHYATHLSPQIAMSCNSCIANPALYGGQSRTLIHVNSTTVYLNESHLDQTPSSSLNVYSQSQQENTINNLIIWLNDNVANVFNNTMTYKQINQEFKNQHPEIEWQEPVAPIKLGQNGISCCAAGLPTQQRRI